MGEFPNKSTQFSSKNQPEGRGRPKGSRNVATVLRELLSTQDKELGGDGDFGSPLAKMLLKIAFDSESSNNDKLKAIKEILDRVEGKSEQVITVNNQPPTWIDEES